MMNTLFICLLFSCCLSSFSAISHANQVEYLDKLLKSRKSENPPNSDAWADLEVDSEYTPVYISRQDGLMEADRIGALPGQPEVDFDQYSGYVTVDPNAGRALFYYFVESPEHSSPKPLVLWLNGGPGCSSLIGAMEEQGPFRVNSDGKTLYRNPYAWNNVANVIFLESPAGVGFSCSNTSSDYHKHGDKNTAKDAYTFLVNWLERFPQYKARDFFLTGESYSGHYVPQLAHAILRNNKNSNQTLINLKGIAIGNAVINDNDNTIGALEYFWTHAMYSDETHTGIQKYCYPNFTGKKCDDVLNTFYSQVGDNKPNFYSPNIYAPLCHGNRTSNSSKGSVHDFDPCTDNYVTNYLNLAEVQMAFHANKTEWSTCRYLHWHDSPLTVLPVIKQLMSNGISVWIYSGDMDGVCTVTSSKYSVNSLKLPIKTPWYPWYTDDEVGGYAVEYEGLVFATVRGAGHFVPSYQPERALTMISSFLQGKLPPSAKYQ